VLTSELERLESGEEELHQSMGGIAVRKPIQVASLNDLVRRTRYGIASCT
jgi:hypothetical protein